MDKEYAFLMENKTWTLVELPKDRKAIHNKWISKIKYKSNGTIGKYKARLVAKGYSQNPGMDFTETFLLLFDTPLFVLFLRLQPNVE